jgi:hypothetical protein
MDPISKAYMSMLEESDKSSGIVASTKSQVGKIFGSESNLPDSDCTTDNVDLETPEEAPAELTSKGADGTPEKLMKKTKNESLNPFDALYNRVLNEEGEFDFSTETENELEPSDEFGSEGEDGSEEGESEEGEDESDEVSITLDRETAQKLVDLLTSVLGEGEGEGEEEEDQTEDEMFGGSDEDSMEDLDGSSEEEDPFKESVDSEELGHAIVKDLDKGHLTSKKNKVVKGAVPVSKKSATSSAIKGADGKIEKHSTDSAISKLTGKNNNVGGVKVGKGLFDQ